MHSSRREATQTSPLPRTAVEADGLGRFLRVGSLGAELETGISVWGICWGAHPGETCKEWGSRIAQGKGLGKDVGPAAAQPQPDPKRKHRSSDGFVGSWHTEARGLGCTSEAVIAARASSFSNVHLLSETSLSIIAPLVWGQFSGIRFSCEL